MERPHARSGSWLAKSRATASHSPFRVFGVLRGCLPDHPGVSIFFGGWRPGSSGLFYPLA